VANRFYITTIALGTLLGDDDSVKRFLLCAHSCQLDRKQTTPPFVRLRDETTPPANRFIPLPLVPGLNVVSRRGPPG
jgi:hypothetical protein